MCTTRRPRRRGDGRREGGLAGAGRAVDADQPAASRAWVARASASSRTARAVASGSCATPHRIGAFRPGTARACLDSRPPVRAQPPSSGGAVDRHSSPEEGSTMHAHRTRLAAAAAVLALAAPLAAASTAEAGGPGAPRHLDRGRPDADEQVLRQGRGDAGVRGAQRGHAAQAARPGAGGTTTSGSRPASRASTASGSSRSERVGTVCYRVKVAGSGDFRDVVLRQGLHPDLPALTPARPRRGGASSPAAQNASSRPR